MSIEMSVPTQKKIQNTYKTQARMKRNDGGRFILTDVSFIIYSERQSQRRRSRDGENIA